MLSNWDRAIAFVLEMEGGYTLDPQDTGGETKYGISHKAYPQMDIKNLTLDQAKDIYRRDYWNVCECEQFPFPYAVAVFDMAVNQGTETAIRTLQKTFGLSADGIVGPKTLVAVQTADDDSRMIKVLLAMRLSVYSRLMASNPKLLVFSRNWSFRVVALAELIFTNKGTEKN